MIRVKTYHLPISLDELDRQPAYEQTVVLRLLSNLTGFTQISFAERGGPKNPIVPHSEEVVHVFPTSGRWENSAEDRLGSSVHPFTIQSLR